MNIRSRPSEFVNQPVRESDLSNVLGRRVSFEEFHGVGDVHSAHAPRLISYIKDEKYISTLNANEFVKGVLCREEHCSLISERILKIQCDDPNFAFFSLVDARARNLFEKCPSQVYSEYDPLVSRISSVGVHLGKGCLIEPNVVIHSGVEIGDNVVIRSGAVLGLDTFQHQRHKGGILSPKHDGILMIEDDVEIGANSCISKGFSYRSTFIGRSTKIDALSYIGHGAKIGGSSIICAGARLMGHVDIGSEVFIGPGATVTSRLKVGDRSRVSLGSVVTKNVEVGARVSGHFALTHEKWIGFIKGIDTL